MPISMTISIISSFYTEDSLRIKNVLEKQKNCINVLGTQDLMIVFESPKENSKKDWFEKTRPYRVFVKFPNLDPEENNLNPELKFTTSTSVEQSKPSQETNFPFNPHCIKVSCSSGSKFFSHFFSESKPSQETLVHPLLYPPR